MYKLQIDFNRSDLKFSSEPLTLSSIFHYSTNSKVKLNISKFGKLSCNYDTCHLKINPLAGKITILHIRCICICICICSNHRMYYVRFIQYALCFTMYKVRV